ncbi:MAG: hypothetical protein HS115_09305 [Spirochaetales bacterium]|nr:hypothetical protein [Spirochaetales bacterium]
MAVLRIVLDLLVYAGIGLFAAWYFYSYKRKDLLGGFWGGMVVGFIGAVIISWFASWNAWFIQLVDWLMKPKFGETLLVRVNLIASLAGAFLLLYVFNRINHNKDR